MAETAKKPDSGLPKVLELQVRDSVSFPPAPAQSRLTIQRDANRPAIGPVPILDMELDRTLGGVVVRYQHRDGVVTYLVPMANIAVLKLAQ
jgi:hypothetical protein